MPNWPAKLAKSGARSGGGQTSGVGAGVALGSGVGVGVDQPGQYDLALAFDHLRVGVSLSYSSSRTQVHDAIVGIGDGRISDLEMGETTRSRNTQYAPTAVVRSTNRAGGIEGAGGFTLGLGPSSSRLPAAAGAARCPCSWPWTIRWTSISCAIPGISLGGPTSTRSSIPPIPTSWRCTCPALPTNCRSLEERRGRSHQQQLGRPSLPALPGGLCQAGTAATRGGAAACPKLNHWPRIARHHHFRLGWRGATSRHSSARGSCQSW